MPHSMTGYGVAEGALAGGRLQCEIRTVNHRHLNIQVRLPAALQPAEEVVRARVRDRLERGHVNVSLRWLEEPARTTLVRVDRDRARAVRDALQQLKDDLALPGEVDLALVLRQPDVLTSGVEDDALPLDADALAPIVDGALEAVVAMRAREGGALGAELLRLLAAIGAGLDRVRERAPARLTAERDRLRTAVAELTDGRPVDDERLAQEVAYLAEKLDVREEIVRLGTHLDAAREALGGNGAVGRRLGFLAQEMLREINTIGSKANDADMAEAVIGMKGDLEKVREQLENLE